MKADLVKRLITSVTVMAVIFVCGAGGAYAGLQDNNNGTITDTATGLIWLKNANCFGMQNWQTAMNSAASLGSGACGLSDKSTAGQWRLPTRDELETRKLDMTGFSGVQLYGYWTSTLVSGSSNSAWYINLKTTYAYYAPKYATHSVLPVRPVR